MSKKLNNLILDDDNIEFNNASEFINHTNRLVYLTGKAGTGKTTFLKYIKKTTTKNSIILAPTGAAAINAGGVTINSFFQIPFGPFIPNDNRLSLESIYASFTYSKDKREIIENLELLIIDEISMVRADTLDVIDRLLRVFRKKMNLPFGGVQVILIGDTFQLPPIAERDQWNILSRFYKTQFFFSSKVIEANIPVYIELKKIYRQNEKEFIDLLNRVRIDEVSANDLALLNSKYDPYFSGDGNDYIILATTNRIVNNTNETKLQELNGESFTFRANVTGDFPVRNMPTDEILNLKVGAQVMFIKNDSHIQRRYFNGKIGKIKTLDNSSIIVSFDDDTEVDVQKESWENISYTYDNEKKKVVEKKIGTFEQHPLRLAWAITVHKSQGLTFEKVIADLGGAFAPGQVYVALSRCTSFNGLKLRSELSNRVIMTDHNVIEFARNVTPDTLIVEELNTGKADYFYDVARESFKNGDLNLSFDSIKKAFKFRNDFDTPIFRKYISVYSKKLFHNSQRISHYSEKLIQSRTRELLHEETINKLECKIENFEEIINTSAQRLKENEAIIESYTNQIKGLKSKEKEYEIESRTLKNETIKLKDENLELKTSSVGLKAELSKTISESALDLNKLKAQLDIHTKDLEINKLNNNAHLIEINRLRNIKWYQKLFGIR